MNPAARTRTVLTAAALAVVLLGCSGQPDPSEPPHPPDPAPQSEPGKVPADAATGSDDGSGLHEPFVAELTMVPAPEEMDRDDDVGAGAAAEYFLYSYTYGYGTGDTGPLEQMAGPECGFCASVIAGVDQAHAEGQYMRAGDPVITGVSTEPAPEDGADYVVWLQAQLPQMRSFDADHTVVEIHPASDIEAGVALTHRDGAWVVLGATFEAAA